MTITIKRSTLVIIILAIALPVTVYAITELFSKTVDVSSDYGPVGYFEYSIADVFTESGQIGIGESKSINPVITSKSSVDAYCFIKIDMPAFGDGGLYEIEPSVDWSLQNSRADSDRWIVIYRYDSALAPGASTTALSNELTMVDMTRAEYGQLTDLNVTMTGYACGTEDLEIADAWDAISQYYGEG